MKNANLNPAESPSQVRKRLDDEREGRLLRSMVSVACLALCAALLLTFADRHPPPPTAAQVEACEHRICGDVLVDREDTPELAAASWRICRSNMRSEIDACASRAR